MRATTFEIGPVFEDVLIWGHSASSMYASKKAQIVILSVCQQYEKDPTEN